MKAAVTTKAGEPSVIEIQEVPVPEVKSGWVLIKVRSFGLNRSELFTRQGKSPNVKFPRIQGIECVGIVQEDPSGTFKKGQQVAAIMGGMGRIFDGGAIKDTKRTITVILQDLPCIFFVMKFKYLSVALTDIYSLFLIFLHQGSVSLNIGKHDGSKLAFGFGHTKLKIVMFLLT